MNKLKLIVLPTMTGAVILAGATAAVAASTITVTPATGLADGQTVTVAGRGFPASTTLFVLECSSPTKEGCDVGRLLPAQSGADGSFTAKLTVHTGAIGNAACDATHPCQVAVSDASNSARAQVPIKFAGAEAASPSPVASASPRADSTSSGGGIPTSAIVLASFAGLAVVGGGTWLVRRR